MFRNQANTQKYMTKYMKGDVFYPIHLSKLGDKQIKNIVSKARKGRLFCYPDTTMTKYISNSILRQWDRPHIMYKDKFDRHAFALELYKVPITHPFVQHLRRRTATFKLTEDYLGCRNELVRDNNNGLSYKVHEALDSIINISPARLAKGFTLARGVWSYLASYILDPSYFDSSIASVEVYPPTDDDFERHLEDWSKRRIETYPCWMEHIK